MAIFKEKIEIGKMRKKCTMGCKTDVVRWMYIDEIEIINMNMHRNP